MQCLAERDIENKSFQWYLTHWGAGRPGVAAGQGRAVDAITGLTHGISPLTPPEHDSDSPLTYIFVAPGGLALYSISSFENFSKRRDMA